MAGKSIRDIKLRGFPAIAAVIGATAMLMGLWLFLGRLLAPSSRLATVPLTTNPSQQVMESPATLDLSPTAESELAQNSSSNEQTPAAVNTTRQGLLRVANLSDHPVRVALLLKRQNATKEAVGSGKNYEPPAHWDFAPGEGRTKGLLLSLPNRSLKVKQGDVLVAFAQDGSRRYWGPYVVGDTTIPQWSAGAAEWQLVLDP